VKISKNLNLILYPQ